MTRDDFNVQATKGGYMIYYKGQPIGGAATLSKGGNLHGKAVSKQVHDYIEMGRMDISHILAGQSGHYAKAIEAIDEQLKEKDNG